MSHDASHSSPPSTGAWPPGLLERATGALAVLAGVLSLAIAALVMTSVAGRWLYNSPIGGDFEIVQMGTAVAVFACLPYCQVRRANIFVDTFTNWIGSGGVRILEAFWDLVYAAMMGVIAYCMSNGARATLASGETTMMLQLAVWPAFTICAVLSGVLSLVALATAVLRLRGR